MSWHAVAGLSDSSGPWFGFSTVSKILKEISATNTSRIKFSEWSWYWIGVCLPIIIVFAINVAVTWIARRFPLQRLSAGVALQATSVPSFFHGGEVEAILWKDQNIIRQFQILIFQHLQNSPNQLRKPFGMLSYWLHEKTLTSMWELVPSTLYLCDVNSRKREWSATPLIYIYIFTRSVLTAESVRLCDQWL